MPFGYALSWEIIDIRTAVLEQSRSADSRALVTTLAVAWFEVPLVGSLPLLVLASLLFLLCGLGLLILTVTARRFDKRIG